MFEKILEKINLTFSSQVPNERILKVGPVISFLAASLDRSFAGSDPLLTNRTHGVRCENCLCINSTLKCIVQITNSHNTYDWLALIVL